MSLSEPERQRRFFDKASLALGLSQSKVRVFVDSEFADMVTVQAQWAIVSANNCRGR